MTAGMGMSPLESWLLLLAVVGGGIGLVLWLFKVDDRDYDAEVPEPPSNVMVADPLPVLDLRGCDCLTCANAAGIAMANDSWAWLGKAR